MTEKRNKNTFLTFETVGKATVNNNTFNIDQVSEKTQYQYSRMSMNVKVSDNRVCRVEQMGGFSNVKANTLFCRTEEGERIDVDYGDRFKTDIIELVRKSDFFHCGIEKDENGKLITRRFLSAYDFIYYLSQHLDNGTPVKVRGEIKIEKYKGETKLKKLIKSVYLVDTEESNYHATFQGDIVITADSLGTDGLESRKEYDIYANLFTYDKQYEKSTPKLFRFTIKSTDVMERFVNRFFKLKREQIHRIGVKGDIFEGFEEIEFSIESLDADLRDLYEMGMISEEQIKKQAQRGFGERVEEYIITNTIMNNNPVTGKPEMRKYEDWYTEEDFILPVKEEKQEESTNQQSNTNDDFMKALDDIPF